MQKTVNSDLFSSINPFVGAGVESYPSAEKESVYSKAPADWSTK